MSNVSVPMTAVNGDRQATLVVSRLLGQSVSIGPDCLVRVVRIGRRRISLAVTAPRNTRILRSEILEVQP